MIDYLNSIDTTVVEKVIIYSDGCMYQNHIINATLLNAILHFYVKSGLHVGQKYLESGHKQMECDSVHRNIKKSLSIPN